MQSTRHHERIDKAAAELIPRRARALRDLILTLADSKRLLGLRYSDCMLGAPTLEAGIAASSMAQDEWGHAASPTRCSATSATTRRRWSTSARPTPSTARWTRSTGRSPWSEMIAAALCSTPR
jgi:hypothetical protein